MGDMDEVNWCHLTPARMHAWARSRLKVGCWCGAGTLGKRLAKAGVENTEINRRDYRELFYTAPGIGAHLR